MCRDSPVTSLTPTGISILSVITYVAEGVLSTSPHPSVPAGSAYVFLLTFDPPTLTSSPDPFGGLQYGFASGSLTIAGATLSGNNLTISIDDRTGEPDRMRIDGIGLSGDFSANVRFNFVGPETRFSSNDFPIPFPTLVDFPIVPQIVLNTSTTNTGSVTVFQPQ